MDASFFNSANLLYVSEEYEEALKHYTCAVTLRDCVEHRSCRAAAHIKLGKFKEAAEDAEEALKLDPESHMPLHWRGVALFYLGDVTCAKVSFEESLRACPEARAPRDQWLRKCNAVLSGSALPLGGDGQIARSIDSGLERSEKPAGDGEAVDLGLKSKNSTDSDDQWLQKCNAVLSGSALPLGGDGQIARSIDSVLERSEKPAGDEQALDLGLKSKNSVDSGLERREKPAGDEEALDLGLKSKNSVDSCLESEKPAGDEEALDPWPKTIDSCLESEKTAGDEEALGLGPKSEKCAGDGGMAKSADLGPRNEKPAGDEELTRSPDHTAQPTSEQPKRDWGQTTKGMDLGPRSGKPAGDEELTRSPDQTAQPTSERPKRDWGQIAKDMDLGPRSGKPAGDEESTLDKLFKEIFEKADADTRRAYIKSFQMPGIIRSTNWSEVATYDSEGKDRPVDPGGQEWRAWKSI